jgi:3-oxoacyl-[acyl-carrier protein] reductase
MLYKDKNILITGTSRGVGRSIAMHFLENGANVAGFSRSNSDIAHEKYFHINVDVGNPSSVMTGFSSLKKIFSSLDILINNAAVLTSQYSMIMSPTSAQSMINVNLLGPFLVSRESAKIMKKNKWGRIINIGSMAASLEPIGDSIYAATKAGLTTLSNVMAKEFSTLGITCNTLAINAIDSDMLAQLPRDKIDEIINSLPISRYSQPADIFNVIDFYASSSSDSITAQTIYLGGVN